MSDEIRDALDAILRAQIVLLDGLRILAGGTPTQREAIGRIAADESRQVVRALGRVGLEHPDDRGEKLGEGG